jgi:hypothetical protein
MDPVPIFELAGNYDLVIQTFNLSTFIWLLHEVKKNEWIFYVDKVGQWMIIHLQVLLDNG